MNRRIIAVVDDMFFASKIRAAAEAVGVEISFPRSTEALVAKARESAPQLILVDLHNQKVDPVGLAKELKANQELGGIRLVGFFSHVETELRAKRARRGLRSSFTPIRVLERLTDNPNHRLHGSICVIRG